MKFNKLFFLTIIFSVNAIKPYIVRIEALKKQFPKRKQYVINAGDVHYGGNNLPEYQHPTLKRQKIANINRNHASAFIKFTQKFPKNKCLFILEDTFNYQGKVSHLKKDYNQAKIWHRQNNYTSCMSFIDDHCKKNKIDIKNVEFRQTQWDFLGNKITAKEFLLDFNFIIKEVRNYNDGKKINNYYAKLLKCLFRHGSKFIKILINNKDKHYYEIVKNNKIKTNDLNEFINYYYQLIDARIVHTILNNKNKKYIFVCAGDWHISNIDNVLKNIDYKTIFSKNSPTDHKPTNVRAHQKNVAALA